MSTSIPTLQKTLDHQLCQQKAVFSKSPQQDCLRWTNETLQSETYSGRFRKILNPQRPAKGNQNLLKTSCGIKIYNMGDGIHLGIHPGIPCLHCLAMGKFLKSSEPQSLHQWICENHSPQNWDRYETKAWCDWFSTNGILLGNLFSQMSILALFIAHIFLTWEHNDSSINLVNSMTTEIQRLSSFAL